VKSFVLHDESENTQGFRMLTSGADLTEFRKNPVMLLNHNDYSLPIGRWDNIRIEGTKILADAVFDETDPQGKQVSDKVERDFVRAASMGAWRPEDIDVIQETDLITGKSTVTVKTWIAREASIVTIPSNHNALAFYDRETGKLMDNSEVLKLFDAPKTEKLIVDNKMFEKIAKILNLADTALEPEVTAAVQVALSDNDRLKAENETLTSRIDELNRAAKALKDAEAVALLDAAVKDGRIDDKGRDNYLKLFSLDYEAAKTAIESIPLRKSVAGQIAASDGHDASELSCLQKTTWDDLDKQGSLTKLKDKYPDLYELKFEQRFGTKPKK
jgi:hypothetical protein